MPERLTFIIFFFFKGVDRNALNTKAFPGARKAQEHVRNAYTPMHAV